MSGSGRGKGKAAGTPKPTAERKSPPKATGAPESRTSPAPASAGSPANADADEDPFDLRPDSANGKVIKGLAKPERGRLHKAVCPMCDKPSFVPKSAIGRQVRCANPKCMIPVFTVPDPDSPATTAAAPSRSKASDSASDAAERAVAPAAKRNPTVVYGIVGAVLIAVAFGAKVLMDGFGKSDTKNLEQPLAPISYGDPTDPQTDQEDDGGTTDGQTTPETPVVEVNPDDEARRIAKQMTDEAVKEFGDKALIRRATASLNFRLGFPEQGDAQMKQLLEVDRARNRHYLQIEPLLTEYWRQVRTGNPAAATARFNAALQFADEIPTTGRIEMEAALALAAAMVNENQISQAVNLLQKHQRDDSQRDAMCGAAWFLTASRLRGIGLPALSVTDVFSWNAESVMPTCVAVDLAVNRRWDAIKQWDAVSKSQEQAGDALANAAFIAVHQEAAVGVLDELEAIATRRDALIGLRIKAVIAGSSRDAARLQDCLAQLEAMPPLMPLPMPATKAMQNYSLPNTPAIALRAAAIAEIARAAAENGDQTSAATAVSRLTSTLLSIAPRTSQTRAAVLKVEGQQQELEKELQEQLGLSSGNQVASAFRNYRTRADQLAIAAEGRRLRLVQLLCHIVDGGGAAAVQSVLAEPGNLLLEELAIDDLAGLVNGTALRHGTELPALKNMPPSMRVSRPERTAETPEQAVGDVLPAAWSQLNTGKIQDAILLMAAGHPQRPLAVSVLPRFRESLINEMIDDGASRTTNSATTVLTALQFVFQFKFPQKAESFRQILQEETYQTVCRAMARRGDHAEVEAWFKADRKTGITDRLRSYYGLALGLADRALQQKTKGKPESP